MKQFIIGRDPGNDRRLNVLEGDGLTILKKIELGVAVDRSVSRNHVRVEIADDGQHCTVTNLKDGCVTAVDGAIFERRSVPSTATLQLGEHSVAVALRDVLAGLVDTSVDTAPLRDVWDDYESRKMKLQVANSRFSNLRSLSILFTLGGAVIPMLFPDADEDWRLWSVLIGVVFTVVMAAIGHVNCERYPKRLKALDNEFQSRYACPACGHFLGTKSYTLLKQDKACPYCKTKFRHA